MTTPTVKDALTAKPLQAKRPKRIRENPEYHQFAQRVVVAYGRRVASGDIEAIRDMCALSEHLDEAIRVAVAGLHGHGYSWTDVAQRLGISRQAAHQRFGTPPEHSTAPARDRGWVDVPLLDREGGTTYE